MSHAEYAPKRLPVLKRLAMALRQIPAVEFALAKFRTLLQGRTNEEPGVTRALLPLAADVANGESTEAIASTPVESDCATGDGIESDAPVIEPAGSATREIDGRETLPVEADTVAFDLEIAPTTSNSAADDDLAPPATTPECLEAAAEPVETAIVAADTAGSEPAEIEIGDAAGDDLPTVADDTDAIVAEASEFTSVTAASDDVAAEATDVAGTDSPAAVDQVESEAVEEPRILAEPIQNEAAESPVAAIDTIEAPALGADAIASTQASSDDSAPRQTEAVAVAPAVAKPDDVCEREALIRRRWKETGMMMWRGAGQSTLCIQGSVALLPPKPGETMPQYDRLEFRLIDGRIVCEGFVVEAPAALKNRPFARAA